uniref:Pyrin domain-containing protein n=1 Tax=Haplochromis burtoni TaxID=8153 RepID=A0A3Q2WAY3_HAPBU
RANTPQDLLSTLEDLGDEEFNKFKWLLHQADVLQSFPTIKKSRLETTNRWDTVDLMVQTYRLPGAVEVAKKILERISRNDLLQSLHKPPLDEANRTTLSEMRF